MVKALALALALLLFACSATRGDPKQRAALLVDKGRNAEAVEVLRAHLAKHPEAIDERRLLIRVYAQMGQLGEAEKQAADLAQRLGPASPIAWIELGFAMEFAHRYDEALALYDRAGEVAPSDPAGPLTGGKRAARWGEVELAEVRLIEALRRDPRNAEAWHTLGLVRLKLGNVSAAEEAYRSGLRADPQALQNRIGLATAALARSDAQAALVQYDAILLQRPRFADAYLGRAYALFKLGRLDDAKKALAEGERLGANPRAVGAQRRAIAQADRRAEPVKVPTPVNNVKAAPQQEPRERAEPPANETQKPPADEVAPSLPEATEPN